MTNEEVIHQSAALRGKRQFREAIDLVNKELPNFGPDTQLNAYHEMFLAAKEAEFKDEALRYAKKLLELEPKLPSAMSYLSQHVSTT